MSTNLFGIVDGRALGGSMRVVVTRADRVGVAKTAVDQVVAAIDAAASRFREESELSRLNRSPDQPFRVSSLLAEAISAGLRGASLTDGAADPTVGSAVRLAGYDRDFASMPTVDAPIKLQALRVPGWRAVSFNPATNTVRIPRGVEVDLGATAKALAADLSAAAALAAVGGGGVLVSLGGDIAVAGEPPEEGWVVQAGEDSAAPIDDSEETVSIQAGGIATSSTTVRRWVRGEVALHHIIDPATGLPAAGPWRTVNVVAASCVDANIASTAAIVMGNRAVAWLEAQGLAARLVGLDGSVKRVAGWPEPGR